MTTKQLVSMGSTAGKVPVGTHMCQIYTDDAERDSSLLAFLVSGLRAGEMAACFSDAVGAEQMAPYFAERGLTLDDIVSSGALSHSGTVYFESGRFTPERPLALMAEFYETARREGFSAARLIGEMVAEITSVAGGDRLIEYEARVTVQNRDKPVTTVCQYDARDFDGSLIMDVLKVHPQMLVRGAVVHNPYFVAPEEILG